MSDTESQVIPNDASRVRNIPNDIFKCVDCAHKIKWRDLRKERKHGEVAPTCSQCGAEMVRDD